MRELPTHVRSKAFKASNGELAWPRENIEEAVAAIRDAKKAILGGEVWLIKDSGNWEGLIPQGPDKSPAVWHWETTQRASTESWQNYCERTAAETIQTVKSMDVEQETPEELHTRLRFNVSFIDEKESP